MVKGRRSRSVNTIKTIERQGALVRDYADKLVKQCFGPSNRGYVGKRL